MTFKKIVEDLIRLDGVVGGLLVGKDGLVISSIFLEEEEAEVLGAMSAAIFRTIAKTADRVGIGSLRHTMVEAKEGSIQIVEADDLILVTIAERRVNLGLIRLEMRNAAKRVHSMANWG